MKNLKLTGVIFGLMIGLMNVLMNVLMNGSLAYGQSQLNQNQINEINPAPEMIAIQGASMVDEFGCGVPPRPGQPRPQCPESVQVVFKMLVPHNNGCENLADLSATVSQEPTQQVLYITRVRAECILPQNSMGAATPVTLQVKGFVRGGHPLYIGNPTLIQFLPRP